MVGLIHSRLVSTLFYNPVSSIGPIYPSLSVSTVPSLNNDSYQQLFLQRFLPPV
jgi:hypothetical protein